MSRRRRPWAWLLLVAFVVVPLAEIYVLVQVGQVIGAGWTILLLVLDSILGTWLMKREGVRAWRALTEALQTGHMPARELADGALIVTGGALMLSPGFVTDALGILLILPLTRPVGRRVLTQMIGKRLLAAPTPRNERRPGPGSGPVVQGEVIADEGAQRPSRGVTDG